MRRAVAVALGVMSLTAAPRPAPAGFFPCDAIVFFGPCRPAPPPGPAQPSPPSPQARPEPREAPTPEPKVEESIWAEPVQGPDGRMRVYLPPRPVREFFDNPTPERARAYLEWNTKRLEAIDRAVAVLQQVSGQPLGGLTSPTAGPPGPLASRPPAPAEAAPGPAAAGRRPAPARALNVLMAFATWCPYSQRQLPIMSQLAQRVPVRGLAFDSPEAEVAALGRRLPFPVTAGPADLRERLGVRSYPTLFVLDGQMVVHVARGFHSLEDLTGILDTLSGGQAPAPAAASATRAGGVSAGT